MKTIKHFWMVTGVVILFQFVAFTATAQEVGLQMYSLRNQFKTDVPGTLKLISDWGITKLEGGGTYGLPLEEYQQLLKQNNLEVVSVGASFEQLQNEPEKAIENAKIHGAKYIMCAWVPHAEGIFALEETQKAITVFNKAGKLIKEAGLILAYHPHGYEFGPYEDRTLFDYMAENAEHFSFEMDVFWIKHPGHDPVALLRKYPSKFVLMHLKDRAHGTIGNQNGRADVETNVVLGKGDVGIAPIIAEAKKMGIEYLFIEDESSRVVEQVPLSLEFLKSLEE